MIDKIKDKIEELKEINFTFEDIVTYIKNIEIEIVLKIIAFILIIPFLYITYNLFLTYQEYKTQIIQKKILEYNNEGLKYQYKVFTANKKDIEKIKLVNGIYKPSLERLYCLISYVNGKLNKKDDVFKKYFITDIKYDEKKDGFSIDINGIKHYNDLIKLLYYLKIFKDILEINYSVKLETVSNGGSNVSYYSVRISGTYDNLQKLIGNLQEKNPEKNKNKKKRRIK